MNARAIAALTVLFMCGSAAGVEAQARKHSWELAAGAIWFGGTDLGDVTATLERPGGGSLDLFRTSTSIDGAPAASAALSFYLTPRVSLEAALSYGRPVAATRVSGDFEDAPAVTSAITLQQYLAEGSVRWYLVRRVGGFRPFLRGGGGYLRQLDAGSALVETGKTVHAGAGADRAFRERATGRLRRLGLRLDARAVARTGGFDIDDKVRVGYAAGVHFFAGF
ncbi:MAG: hypothetical protein M3R55_16990 [Acidobacteriota bacterium]|nr:hypothetical protein [Acidobacteriota bacterium]